MTVLTDGRVLVAGGVGASDTLASLEIYDPVTGVFGVQSASLAIPRSHHTATRLEDGRVLLTGGRGGDGSALSSAELFDPADGSLTTIAMTTPRRDHTATLIPDSGPLHGGGVLVAGGSDGTSTVRSLELFDPDRSVFELLLSEMTTPRESHTATRLDDGRIVFIGGRSSGFVLASSEYFDPVTKGITAGPFLAEGRYAHTSSKLPAGDVVVAGGTDGVAHTSSIEIFAPESEVIFDPGHALLFPRSGHVAVVLPQNGHVLLIGGDGEAGPVAEVEEFHPAMLVPGPSGALDALRGVAAAAAGAGRILVSGGATVAGPVATAAVFRYATLATDRFDYPPNTPVRFAGTGWAPGETVQIEVLGADGAATQLVAVADAQGEVSNSEFVTRIEDAGVLFSVMAVGETSGVAAFTEFQDSHSLSALTPSSLSETTSGATVIVSGSNLHLGTVWVDVRDTSGSATRATINARSFNTLTVTIPGSITTVPGTYFLVVFQQITTTSSHRHFSFLDRHCFSHQHRFFSELHCFFHEHFFFHTHFNTSTHVSNALTMTVLNVAPTANAGGPYTVNEGSSVGLSGTGADPGPDVLSFAWDLDNDGVFETSGSSPTFSAAALDGPGSRTIRLRVCDDGPLCSTSTTTVDIFNVAPSVGTITAPLDPVAVGNAILATATFTDPGTPDTHTATWDWGDGPPEAGTLTQGAGSGSVTDPHTYTVPGLYTLELTVEDDDGGVDTQTFQFVVVYDPAGGFVTGGGWIDSPWGAYHADPSLTGKASFGFVSKYKKGATTPTGQTEFQFKLAGLNFHSASYDWLVVAGARAQYKGVGTIGGAGNYGFMLTCLDAEQTASAEQDRFRIKIWDRDAGDAVVYDNQPGDADDSGLTADIGAGSIVIHTGGKGGK